MNATISDLLTAILSSEMSPVNKVLLTTELSRVLEETPRGIEVFWINQNLAF